MLIGYHTRNLDLQNLLSVPVEFRKSFQDGVYATQGFDRNIMLLTRSAFEKLYERVTSFSLSDPLARGLLRMILGTAHETALGPDGGMSIPNSLKEFAQLSGEVVLVGVGDYIEVWSPEYWKRQEEQLSNIEENAHKFATLDLSTHRVSAQPLGG